MGGGAGAAPAWGWVEARILCYDKGLRRFPRRFAGGGAGGAAAVQRVVKIHRLGVRQLGSHFENLEIPGFTMG